MELRSFRPSDLETLFEIDRACFPPGISYSRRELADFVGGENSQTWVAAEGGAIVGFLIADCDPEGVGHIITIDVVEAWRRRGAGKALMEAAEDWGERRRLRMIVLETAEDNLAAQRFYESRGYRKVEIVANYYPNGSAAWVMVKKLKSESNVKS